MQQLTNRIQQCTTLLGQLGQGLDANTAASCNEAAASQSEYLGSVIAGIIIFFGSIAGIVLIKADDRKKEIKLNQNLSSPSSPSNLIPPPSPAPSPSPSPPNPSLSTANEHKQQNNREKKFDERW